MAGKDDIVSRAKELQRQPLPKRFYKTASFGPSKSGGFAILLDGRPIRTPGRAGVEVPAEELARRVAAEWEKGGRFTAADRAAVVAAAGKAERDLRV